MFEWCGGLPALTADDAPVLREPRARGSAARAAVREHVPGPSRAGGALARGGVRRPEAATATATAAIRGCSPSTSASAYRGEARPVGRAAGRRPTRPGSRRPGVPVRVPRLRRMGLADRGRELQTERQAATADADAALVLGVPPDRPASRISALERTPRATSPKSPCPPPARPISFAPTSSRCSASATASR